jgi:DNA repair protein RadC
MKIKNIPQSERPRERLLKYGSEKLSNEELLSIILKTGTKKQSVKEISTILLSKINNIQNLKDISINSLMEIEGIGEVKAIELKAVIELGKRIYQDVSYEEVIKCTSPSNIIGYFNYLLKDKKQEEFYVLYLDKKKKLLGNKKLFVGTIDSSLSHPREIFKEAYLLSSSYIICIHNHPSGDATPSVEDEEFTRKIQEIGIIHGIPLLDHLIIGNDNYFSFYENNYIINNVK